MLIVKAALAAALATAALGAVSVSVKPLDQAPGQAVRPSTYEQFVQTSGIEFLASTPPGL